MFASQMRSNSEPCSRQPPLVLCHAAFHLQRLYCRHIELHRRIGCSVIDCTRSDDRRVDSRGIAGRWHTHRPMSSAQFYPSLSIFLETKMSRELCPWRNFGAAHHRYERRRYLGVASELAKAARLYNGALQRLPNVLVGISHVHCSILD